MRSSTVGGCKTRLKVGAPVHPNGVGMGFLGQGCGWSKPCLCGPGSAHREMLWSCLEREKDEYKLKNYVIVLNIIVR